MARAALRRTLAVSLACCASWVSMAARAADEAEVKAAIVYNILLFVDWPTESAPAAGGVLQLCVGPASAMVSALKALHRRPIKGMVLEVRDLPVPSEPQACHAVFIDAADRQRMAASIKAQRAGGALMLSDDADAPVDATAIVLQRVGNKIAFEVNMPAVRQSGVHLSSKLLRLARTVRE